MVSFFANKINLTIGFIVLLLIAVSIFTFSNKTPTKEPHQVSQDVIDTELVKSEALQEESIKSLPPTEKPEKNITLGFLPSIQDVESCKEDINKLFILGYDYLYCYWDATAPKISESDYPPLFIEQLKQFKKPYECNLTMEIIDTVLDNADDFNLDKASQNEINKTCYNAPGDYFLSRFESYIALKETNMQPTPQAGQPLELDEVSLNKLYAWGDNSFYFLESGGTRDNFDIMVIEESGLKTGVVGNLLYEEIPNSSVERISQRWDMSLDTYYSYTVIVEGRETGLYELYYGSPYGGFIIMYPPVELTPGTVITYSIPSRMTHVPYLEMDYDGDAIIDELVYGLLTHD